MTQTSLPYVIDLPFPISANRLWRRSGTRIYTSPAYKAWLIDADRTWLMYKKPGPPVTLEKYELDVVLDARRRHGNADGDNLLKCINDWLQRVEIIRDDKFCERWGGSWGIAPLGCIVEIRPLRQDLTLRQEQLRTQMDKLEENLARDAINELGRIAAALEAIVAKLNSVTAKTDAGRESIRTWDASPN